MPGFTPFTSNYQDLSSDQGYQFEFRCDICGSGYRSEFEKNLLGMGGSILSGASSVIGGLWGARNAASAAHDITDRGARDKALEKASNEIMPLFHRCVQQLGRRDVLQQGARSVRQLRPQPRRRDGGRAFVGRGLTDARRGPGHHGVLG